MTYRYFRENMFFELYKRFLRWTMDVAGVTRSVSRKILMAVGIQFTVSIAVVIISLLFSDVARLVGLAALFALAIVAFVNTVVIVRADFIEPIERLERAATGMAEGTVSVDVPPAAQDDEVGDLIAAFHDMQHHFQTVSEQADALADQQFDAPELDRELPGPIGHSLSTMTDHLESYIDQIEMERDRVALLGYLVSHDVPNLITVVYSRIELIRAEFDDEELLAQLDVIEDQVEEVEVISNTVGQLTSKKSTVRLDLASTLRDVLDRIETNYPDAAITADIPDDPVYVQGNELLVRVFENLIENGIEHNDAATPRVHVSVEATDGDAVVHVDDNGPGLDVTDADSLFDEAKPGTGLHIVATLVAQLDGEIDLTTGDGGTEFVVTFPDSTASNGTTRRGRDGPTPFGGPTTDTEGRE